MLALRSPVALLPAALLAAVACASAPPPRPMGRHHVAPGLTPRPTGEAFPPDRPDLAFPRAGRVGRFAPIVVAAAEEFGVPPDLMLGLVWVESRFNPRAVSKAGARGLTQLMPATARAMARRLGVDPDRADPHEPRFAARAGAAYLALQLARCRGAQTCALAAYAAGPARVARTLVRHGRLPKGGLRYAHKVRKARRRFSPAGRDPG